MTNNDKLKQIAGNLQSLNYLVDSMKDSELYPVSFFSNAFDLIQKIQNDVHALEAEQVELFASQMKKHQDLIISIHQQVHNIENISENKKTEAPAPTKEKPVEQSRPQIKDYNFGEINDIQVNKSDNTRIQRKPSLFGKILGKDAPEEKQTLEEVKEEVKGEVKGEVKEVIEEVKEVRREVKEEVKEVGGEVREVIEEVKEVSDVVEVEESVEIVTLPINVVEENKSVINQPLSLNDVIERNKLSDLRKAFSLNDSFRYRRELFGNKEDVMNNVIAELNKKHSLKESITYLEEKLNWDVTDPSVKDFLKKLEIRFI
jgi:hypothetical protein